MRFKEPRQNQEFSELKTQNPRLYALMLSIDSFVTLEMKKDVCVTSIFRTEAEHKALYAQTPNPPATSPHCFWEAVDLRSTDFTPTEIVRINGYANQFTFRNNKPVCLYHQVTGGVFHFHFQYGKTA